MTKEVDWEKLGFNISKSNEPQVTIVKGVVYHDR